MTRSVPCWSASTVVTLLTLSAGCSASRLADAEPGATPAGGPSAAAGTEGSGAAPEPRSGIDAGPASPGESSAENCPALEGEFVAGLGPEWQACERDEDCTWVETSCSSCCEPGAVAVDKLQCYRDRFWSEVCDGFFESGEGVCDCYFLPFELSCVDQRCTIVPGGDDVPPRPPTLCTPPEGFRQDRFDGDSQAIRDMDQITSQLLANCTFGEDCVTAVFDVDASGLVTNVRGGDPSAPSEHTACAQQALGGVCVPSMAGQVEEQRTACGI